MKLRRRAGWAMLLWKGNSSTQMEYDRKLCLYELNQIDNGSEKKLTVTVQFRSTSNDLSRVMSMYLMVIFYMLSMLLMDFFSKKIFFLKFFY